MILADTSVWIDHLHGDDRTMRGLLEADQIILHPYVIGEIALGTLKNRSLVLRRLSRLPSALISTVDEVMRFIDAERLSGIGIGYVDAHLLASARITGDTYIWTRDRRMRRAAESLGLCAPIS